MKKEKKNDDDLEEKDIVVLTNGFLKYKIILRKENLNELRIIYNDHER